MRLPNGEAAIVAEEKLRDYLLSVSHPTGRFKSTFFRALGFEANGHSGLEAALRALLSGEAELVGASEFGTKYVVRGLLQGPGGQVATVVTVWIILTGEAVPRFVTAYPGN